MVTSTSLTAIGLPTADATAIAALAATVAEGHRRESRASAEKTR